MLYDTYRPKCWAELVGQPITLAWQDQQLPPVFEFGRRSPAASPVNAGYGMVPRTSAATGSSATPANEAPATPRPTERPGSQPTARYRLACSVATHAMSQHAATPTTCSLEPKRPTWPTQEPRAACHRRLFATAQTTTSRSSAPSRSATFDPDRQAARRKPTWDESSESAKQRSGTSSADVTGHISPSFSPSSATLNNMRAALQAIEAGEMLA